MDVFEKLAILADAAKYDVSCSSSGSEKIGSKNQLGSTAAAGICHSWADDGRCISLLKILMTNVCVYDCAYCVNRVSNELPRALFEVDEIVDLTIQFYRRNYIEGLFLSSGVVISPNETMERLISVVKKLREEQHFNGYIHLKGIPGADPKLIEEAGRYCDRMSLNLELPTTQGLKLLAPQKNRDSILTPMLQIKEKRTEYQALKKTIKSTPDFVPAGQSTQVLVGASDETDLHILAVSQALYAKMDLKRVYYSAYVPVSNHPALTTYSGKPAALKREHRIYQADWLMRFYEFKAEEIVNESMPFLDMDLDPKCQWAVNHLEFFPMEINKVPLKALLRIPGIGPTSARRIVKARRYSALSYDDLKGLGVVLKRAKHFITCKGKFKGTFDFQPLTIKTLLLDGPGGKLNQLNMFETYPNLFLEADKK